MTLIGPRHEWQELLRRNDEGVGLKDEHVACIERALADASPDASQVEVDAGLTALKQTHERTATARERGYALAYAQIGGDIADHDESWWLHRARELGLLSIVPVEPWPRRPKRFYRPPGHLHTYGVNNREMAVSMDAWIEDQKRCEADDADMDADPSGPTETVTRDEALRAVNEARYLGFHAGRLFAAESTLRAYLDDDGPPDVPSVIGTLGDAMVAATEAVLKVWHGSNLALVGGPLANLCSVLADEDSDSMARLVAYRERVSPADWAVIHRIAAENAENNDAD